MTSHESLHKKLTLLGANLGANLPQNNRQLCRFLHRRILGHRGQATRLHISRTTQRRNLCGQRLSRRRRCRTARRSVTRLRQGGRQSILQPFHLVEIAQQEAVLLHNDGALFGRRWVEGRQGGAVFISDLRLVLARLSFSGAPAAVFAALAGIGGLKRNTKLLKRFKDSWAGLLKPNQFWTIATKLGVK
jgi:hypothetical protein